MEDPDFAEWRIQILQNGGSGFCRMEDPDFEEWRILILQNGGSGFCRMEDPDFAEWRIQILQKGGSGFCKMEDPDFAEWRIRILLLTAINILFNNKSGELWLAEFNPVWNKTWQYTLLGKKKIIVQRRRGSHSQCFFFPSLLPEPRKMET